MPENVFTEEQRDALQEIANLAMGQAATRGRPNAACVAAAMRSHVSPLSPATG